MGISKPRRLDEGEVSVPNKALTIHRFSEAQNARVQDFLLRKGIKVEFHHCASFEEVVRDVERGTLVPSEVVAIVVHNGNGWPEDLDRFISDHPDLFDDYKVVLVNVDWADFR